MGGRGLRYDEIKKNNQSDNWSWLSELTDKRLENYGKMSWHQSDDGGSKDALNYYAVKEYENRNGFTPDWKIKT